MPTNEEIIVKFKGDISALQKDLNTIKGQLGEVDKNTEKVNKSMSGLNSTMSNVGTNLAAYFAIDRLVSFGREVVKITAEFQKFEAVLTNTLGDRSKALKVLSDIKQFAATTPFTVKELTESFVKLANRGVAPTIKEMRKIGDVASTLGKDFEQVVEAIIDVNNSERWRELGINAEQAGNKMIFTFKGTRIETEKTVAGVTDAIAKLGELNGVAGQTDAVAKTLGGALSNLEDAFQRIQVAIGTDADKGGLSYLIRTLTDKINSLASTVELHGVVSLKSLLEVLKITSPIGFLTSQIIGTDEAINKLDESIRDIIATYEGFSDIMRSDEVKEATKERIKQLKEQENALKKLREEQEKLRLEQKRLNDEISLSNQQADPDEVIFINDTFTKKPSLDGDVNINSVEDQIKAEGELLNQQEKDLLNSLELQEQAKIEFYNNSINLAIELANFEQQMSQNRIDQAQFEADEQTKILQNKYKAGLINEDEYSKGVQNIRENATKKIREEERKQAQISKATSLFEIGIDTAKAVMQTYATLGFTPFGVPAAIAVGAIGAAQLAAVASTPIPKFAKGGKIQGRKHIDGGTLIEAEHGEYITPAFVASSYIDELESMRTMKFDKLIEKKYIAPALKKQKEKYEQSMASNIYKSMQVNADLNDSNLLMSDMKTRAILKQIAESVKKNNNGNINLRFVNV